MNPAGAHASAPEQPHPHRRAWTLLGVGIAAIAVLSLSIAAVLVDQGRSEPTPPPSIALPNPPASNGVGLPPWPAPQPPNDNVAAAGLQLGKAAEFTPRSLTHLDILLDGKPTAVPGYIGVSKTTGEVSALHTLDKSGVIRVESLGEPGRFTLGQFFVEWGVRLTSDQIGGLKNNPDSILRTFVNGNRFFGDPATIELMPQLEIALVFGPDVGNVDIPSAYTFPPNE